jgi:hypothetical protein
VSGLAKGLAFVSANRRKGLGNFGPLDSEKAIYFAAPEVVVGFRLGMWPIPYVLAFVHVINPLDLAGEPLGPP